METPAKISFCLCKALRSGFYANASRFDLNSLFKRECNICTACSLCPGLLLTRTDCGSSPSLCSPLPASLWESAVLQRPGLVWETLSGGAGSAVCCGWWGHGLLAVIPSSCSPGATGPFCSYSLSLGNDPHQAVACIPPAPSAYTHVCPKNIMLHGLFCAVGRGWAQPWCGAVLVAGLAAGAGSAFGGAEGTRRLVALG